MIKSLELKNWKTHQNSQFEFGSGTNVLVGVLGAGKTSVMDGICYALYGTFPTLQSKKVSVEEVLTRKPYKADSASVKLEFKCGEKNYSVERVLRKTGVNEARLLEEGRLIAGPKVNEVTDRIEKLLQVNYDLFSRAVYTEQNQVDYFLKLSPGQRREKFDELLEFDKYEKVRGQAVQVQNRLKKLIEDKKSFLKELTVRLGEKDLNELQEKIVKKEALLIETYQKLNSMIQEEGKLHESFQELEIKGKKWQELREKALRSKSKIEQLSSQLKGKTMPKEQNMEIEIANAEKQLKQAKEQFNSFNQLQGSMQMLLQKIARIEQELNASKNKQPLSSIQEEIAKTKQKTTDIQAVEKTILQEKAGIMQKLKELEKQEKDLKGVSAECPICKTKLDALHKKELLEQNSFEKKNCQEAWIQIEKQLNACTKQMLEYEHTLDQLEEGKQAATQIEIRQKELSAHYTEKIVFERQLATLKENTSEEKLDNLQEKLEAAREIKKLTESFKELDKLKGEELQVIMDIEGLQFNEKEYDEQKRRGIELKSVKEFTQKEIDSIQESIQENKQLLSAHQKIKTQIDELSQSISKMDKGKEKIGLFVQALVSTQNQLREVLINSINEAMDDIWGRIYPYKDYVSCKIEIVGGEYEVVVKEKTGEWTRVEGILSGGERSAAALTMRIAIALVLTRNLSWLILDEPTHNLDGVAVVKLSNLMREHLPELVEQIFIITHNKAMEEAATYCTYILERDKDNNGMTRPVQNSFKEGMNLEENTEPEIELEQKMKN